MLYRKLLRSLLPLFLLTLLGSQELHAQRMNNPFYDYKRRVHFGFTLGTNFSSFKYQFDPSFYQMDSVLSVNMISYPGLHLGAISNMHIGDHFDLRFIPTLVLAQRAIEYNMGDSMRTTVTKEIESVLIEAPLHLKFKSVRFRNMRFYVIGGGKYSYDMSSDAGSNRNPRDPEVYVYPNNFYYEVGAGLDFYFPYFKFSPEIKISRGLNNVLEPDDGIYSAVFDSFKSQFVFISLYFE